MACVHVAWCVSSGHTVRHEGSTMLEQLTTATRDALGRELTPVEAGTVARVAAAGGETAADFLGFMRLALGMPLAATVAA